MDVNHCSKSILVTDAYYLVDEDASLRTFFQRAYSQKISEINPTLENHFALRTVALRLDEEASDSETLHAMLQTMVEERVKALREGDASFSWETCEMTRRDGRSAPMLFLIIDVSSIFAPEKRLRLISQLETVKRQISGVVIIAVSDEDVEIEDEDVKKIAHDFKRVVGSDDACWTRIIAASARRQARGKIARPEELVDTLTSILATDVLYKEESCSRTLSREPGFSFSFEVFGAKSLEIDLGDVATAILPLYREGLIRKLRGAEEPTGAKIPKLNMKKVVEASGFALKTSFNDEPQLKTRDGRYALTPPDRWRFNPISRQSLDVSYLSETNDSMKNDVARMVKNASKRFDAYRLRTTSSLSEFAVKAALFCKDSDRPSEYFAKLRSFVSQFEATSNATRPETTRYDSCVVELNRVPRFFFKYFVFTVAFAIISVAFLSGFRIKLAAGCSVVALASVGLWLLRKYAWKKRFEKALNDDFEHMKNAWLSVAVEELARRSRFFCKATLERIAEIESLSMNFNNAVAEAAKKKGETSFQITPLLSENSLPNVMAYLHSRGLEDKNDVALFTAMLTKTMKAVVHGEASIDDVSGKIDEYCNANLNRLLGDLTLDFFLRDGVGGDMNIERFLQTLSPSLEDVYARGSLVNEVVAGNAEGLRWRSRNYLLAGFRIGGGRQSDNFTVVDTGWRQKALAVRFVELYDGAEMLDKVPQEEMEPELV